MIYCVIPREWADSLYPQMVAHYADNPDVTVIIDRREGPNRRSKAGSSEVTHRREQRDRRRARAVGTFPVTDEPSAGSA